MTLIPDKKFTSEDVLDALRAKHAEDLFVPECKNGPSHSEMFKLDAWVMNRSWANACVTGYEIKVSRSDFVRDEKWRAYLPMCNQLYFVVPPHLPMVLASLIHDATKLQTELKKLQLQDQKAA